MSEIKQDSPENMPNDRDDVPGPKAGESSPEDIKMFSEAPIAEVQTTEPQGKSTGMSENADVDMDQSEIDQLLGAVSDGDSSNNPEGTAALEKTNESDTADMDQSEIDQLLKTVADEDVEDVPEDIGEPKAEAQSEETADRPEPAEEKESKAETGPEDSAESTLSGKPDALAEEPPAESMVPAQPQVQAEEKEEPSENRSEESEETAAKPEPAEEKESKAETGPEDSAESTLSGKPDALAEKPPTESAAPADQQAQTSVTKAAQPGQQPQQPEAQAEEAGDTVQEKESQLEQVDAAGAQEQKSEQADTQPEVQAAAPPDKSEQPDEPAAFIDAQSTQSTDEEKPEAQLEAKPGAASAVGAQQADEQGFSSEAGQEQTEQPQDGQAAQQKEAERSDGQKPEEPLATAVEPKLAAEEPPDQNAAPAQQQAPAEKNEEPPALAPEEPSAENVVPAEEAGDTAAQQETQSEQAEEPPAAEAEQKDPEKAEQQEADELLKQELQDSPDEMGADEDQKEAAAQTAGEQAEDEFVSLDDAEPPQDSQTERPQAVAANEPPAEQPEEDDMADLPEEEASNLLGEELQPQASLQENTEAVTAEHPPQQQDAEPGKKRPEEEFKEPQQQLLQQKVLNVIKNNLLNTIPDAKNKIAQLVPKQKLPQFKIMHPKQLLSGINFKKVAVVCAGVGFIFVVGIAGVSLLSKSDPLEVQLVKMSDKKLLEFQQKLELKHNAKDYPVNKQVLKGELVRRVALYSDQYWQHIKPQYLKISTISDELLQQEWQRLIRQYKSMLDTMAILIEEEIRYFGSAEMRPSGSLVLSDRLVIEGRHRTIRSISPKEHRFFRLDKISKIPATDWMYVRCRVLRDKESLTVFEDENDSAYKECRNAFQEKLQSEQALQTARAILHKM